MSVRYTSAILLAAAFQQGAFASLETTIAWIKSSWWSFIVAVFVVGARSKTAFAKAANTGSLTPSKGPYATSESR